MNHARDFNRKDVRALAKKGIEIVGSQYCCDPCDPITTYAIMDGDTYKLRLWGEVVEMVRELDAREAAILAGQRRMAAEWAAKMAAKRG